MATYTVNYYYYPDDVEPPSEGELLHLCRQCKDSEWPDAYWASQGDDDLFCEECGVSNNPESELATRRAERFLEV